MKDGEIDKVQPHIEEMELGCDGDCSDDEEIQEGDGCIEDSLQRSALDYSKCLKKAADRFRREQDYSKALLKYQDVMLSLQSTCVRMMDHNETVTEMGIECTVAASICAFHMNSLPKSLNFSEQVVAVCKRELSRLDRTTDQSDPTIFRQKILHHLESGFLNKIKCLEGLSQRYLLVTAVEEYKSFFPSSDKLSDILEEVETSPVASGQKRRKTEGEFSKKNPLSTGDFGGVPKVKPSTEWLRSRCLQGGLSRDDRINFSSNFLFGNQGQPKKIANYPRRAYSGQYSPRGDLFVSTCQDWRVRLYSTQGGKLQGWRTIKAVCRNYTLTDACISEDSTFLAYSSITPTVHLYNIHSSRSEDSEDSGSNQELLNFAGRRLTGAGSTEHQFGLWSLRFSCDKRHIIAGGSDDALYLYDVERKERYRYTAHTDEVNAVAFSHSDETNVIITGSDDCMIYIWDTRAMGCNSKKKPQGMLVGHTEGITSLDSKGDGRYIVSNSKDQLWDVRCSMTYSSYVSCLKPRRAYQWDYRASSYPGNPRTDVHPSDRSIITCIGHTVLRTLIRCRFSPENTGRRYVYTGSHDGTVHVYDLAGKTVARLDTGEGQVVRDVSWHPSRPTLIATSWDGSLHQFD
ncbi:hypothetical protein PROFUN_11135 [Planoprotostelium fungivorum]|uniref:Uncharacterized protein n=1 Tax=Planoprotostelium fungivorum TaxID=1890364 RepID=A0A2P6NAS9_9EUKA|nr:hypothetical protein PROFUN_11135 [Planoprotostelium fungivorum]